jgi:hypothetical protein
VTLILDAGALIALDRGDRAAWVRLKRAGAQREVPVTHAGVLGQVWRGGPRQARLAAALHGIDVRPLDEPLGRACGALLAVAEQGDVIDAAVALLAADGDTILTSDTADLVALAYATGRHVEVVEV